MKKLFTWCFLLGKRTIKNPLLIILMLVMPLLALAANKIPSFHNDVSYEAGIYFDGTDELSAALMESVLGTKGIFSFTEYTDIEEMTNDVKTKKICCGYILPDDLSERVELKEIYGCIQVIMQPSESLQPAINEYMYAELIRLQNYNILTEYVTDKEWFAVTDTDSMEELIEYYEYYADSDKTFHINFETYGDSGLQTNEDAVSTIAFPIRGILSIMVFLSGIFGCVTFLSDKEKGIFETINIKYRILCQILYVLIPTLLFAISAMLTIVFSGIWTGALRELIGMLILILLTLAFSQLLIVVTRKSSVCIACIPGLLIGCLIFCPVFVQVSYYVPAAEFIEKLFVPYYYLKLF